MHNVEEGAMGVIINRPLDKQVSELVTDPAIKVDFIVITGVTTPQLTPPPVP